MYVLEIEGKPIPQKQTQFNRYSGHAYNPNSTDQKILQAKIKPFAPNIPLTCPVFMELDFYFQPPKSISKVKRLNMLSNNIKHVTRPDVDNCAYFVTNALKKIFYQDDSQVYMLYLRKFYSEKPKTIIKITPLE